MRIRLVGALWFAFLTTLLLASGPGHTEPQQQGRTDRSKNCVGVGCDGKICVGMGCEPAPASKPPTQSPSDESPYARPSDLFYNEGVEHEAAKRWTAAETAFRRAVDVDPTDEDAWVRLGRTDLELGHHEAAIAAYQAAIGLKGTDPEAHAGLGTALTDLGRWQEAADAWQRWAELDPGDALAPFRLGCAQLGLERYAPAAESFRQAIAIDPTGASFPGSYS
jgi:tetratricopeptide (TPR) repeat protein